jgi:hypothetical protein
MPFQEALVPAGREDNVFLPDPRIWTVLYSWRVPGFDADGNGFIGFDGASFSGQIVINGAVLSGSALRDQGNAPSSEHRISDAVTGGGSNELDGQVTASCGALGFGLVSLTGFGIAGLARARRIFS